MILKLGVLIPPWRSPWIFVSKKQLPKQTTLSSHPLESYWRPGVGLLRHPVYYYSIFCTKGFLLVYDRWLMKHWSIWGTRLPNQKLPKRGNLKFKKKPTFLCDWDLSKIGSRNTISTPRKIPKQNVDRPEILMYKGTYRYVPTSSSAWTVKTII